MAVDLIPYWSGALDRAGQCPSLSSYSGGSSLNHSPAPDGPSPPPVPALPGRRLQRLSPTLVARVKRLLKREGESWTEIAKTVGVSRYSVARIAKGTR